MQNRAARFVTQNYTYEAWNTTSIIGEIKWETLKKKKKDKRLILLYKVLNGKARVPTDDHIQKNMRCRNQHFKAFQTPSATTNIY